jgi:tRNA pseudouridine55 synthase
LTDTVGGLVVVDKPAGWTSHDVVARMRRIAGTRKVGHAGTLDPMATGVLVIGIGRATRLLGHLAHRDKDYLATIRLGQTTTTDDAEGELLASADPTGVTDDAIAGAVADLQGEIDQVPSSVSAIKIDGVRAYRLARAGNAVELAPRRVRVDVFHVRDRRGADVDVAVTCSSGTYVRALARDLGATLGVGAHLTALRRTRVGPFTVGDAKTLEELERSLHLVSLSDAVAAAFPRWPVDDETARRLAVGQRLPARGERGIVGAFAPDGSVVALVEDRDGATRPLVVFVQG